MTWVSVSAFNIGIGRIDPILIPSPLSSPQQLRSLMLSGVNGARLGTCGNSLREESGA